jgi:hypothetical protein
MNQARTLITACALFALILAAVTGTAARLLMMSPLTDLPIFPTAANRMTAVNRQGVLQVPQVAELRQTVNRPLFDERRRPPEVRAPRLAVAPPPTSPVPSIADSTVEGYRLIGVFTDGDTRKALIQIPGGKLLWTARGDVVGAWTLSIIEKERVELLTNGRTGELKLYPAVKQ